jgi:Domain of unknown function (DUF6754)
MKLRLNDHNTMIYMSPKKTSSTFPIGAPVLLTVTLLAFAMSQSSALAQETGGEAATSQVTLLPPTAPSALTLEDAPNDAGRAVIVTFVQSPAPVEGQALALGYEIYRAVAQSGPWKKVGTVPSDEAATLSYKDAGGSNATSADYLPTETDLFYRIRAVTADSALFVESEIAGPVQAVGQWWNNGRNPVFWFVLLFTILTLYFLNAAKKRGDSLYVRPLAGIDAVDEAIGRATEMGKPILYVLGLGTASDIATIASFTILGRVSRKVAEYQTDVIVPCYDPIVFTIAQETVRTGYMDAGRPDAYRDDQVYFVTQAQFAYVAAVNGTILRDRPATNIYLGKFYAESLILAETGAIAGSIQIAGTDEIAQLPFFVVACDYTLIGEELYAASAYLGREPLLLGALKAQDFAKAAIVVLAIAGVIMAGFGYEWFAEAFEAVG